MKGEGGSCSGRLFFVQRSFDRIDPPEAGKPARLRQAGPPQGRRASRTKRSSHAEPAEDTEKNRGYFRQDDPREMVLTQFHEASSPQGRRTSRIKGISSEYEKRASGEEQKSITKARKLESTKKEGRSGGQKIIQDYDLDVFYVF